MRRLAWIGDAVLALHARLRILREQGAVDGERAVAMTSNQFLATMGEPTAVEAAIGQVFLDSGLEAALAHIDAKISPQFDRQELKRRRPAQVR